MMHLKIYWKFYLFLIVSIIGILLVVIINRNYRTPEEAIHSEYMLTLPSASKIIHFNTSYAGGFDAKISIEKKDLEQIRKDLLWHFRQEEDITNQDNIPNIDNVVHWWFKDKSEITNFYEAFDDGKYAKTRIIYAFIVREKVDNYYLYLSCGE